MGKKDNKAKKSIPVVAKVVIIGMIVAFLATGIYVVSSYAWKQSRIDKAASDLNVFAKAAEKFLRETPSVANAGGKDKNKFGDMDGAFVKSLNAVLPSEYKVTETVAENSMPCDKVAVSEAKNAIVFKSMKVDPWGNPYFVIFDPSERHELQNNDFYITVISAGPNMETTVNGNIDADDLFMLAQYKNGDIESETYNVAEDTIFTYDTEVGSQKKLYASIGVYADDMNAPTNF